MPVTRILILFSSTDGHTETICRRLQAIIGRQQHHVEVISIDDEEKVDLEAFDKIVVGASIRYGKHRPEVYAFIERNLAILNSKPSAFFSVNVVARKADKNRPDTNPYLIKFLKQIPWQPKIVAVFAGKIDYRKYGFWDRLMIRLIMWMTHGPTDPRANIEYTDWNQVEAFAIQISDA